MTDSTLPSDNDITTANVLAPFIERAQLYQNFQSRDLDLVEHVRTVRYLYYVLINHIRLYLLFIP